MKNPEFRSENDNFYFFLCFVLLFVLLAVYSWLGYLGVVPVNPVIGLNSFFFLGVVFPHFRGLDAGFEII